MLIPRTLEQRAQLSVSQTVQTVMTNRKSCLEDTLIIGKSTWLAHNACASIYEAHLQMPDLLDRGSSAE